MRSRRELALLVMAPQNFVNGVRIPLWTLLLAVVSACSGSKAEVPGGAGGGESAGVTGSGGSAGTVDGAGAPNAFGGATDSSGAGGLGNADAKGGASVGSALGGQAGAVGAGGTGAGGTIATSHGGSPGVGSASSGGAPGHGGSGPSASGSNGGAAAGGADSPAHTGGSPSGGTAAGGSSSGGTAAGGSSSGGTAAGGTSTGGTAAGGSSNTGTSNGGIDSAGTSTGGAAGSIDTGGAAARVCAKGTQNLFVDALGKTSAEVDDKLTLAVKRFFGIDSNEPSTPTQSSGYRCYYELPDDPTRAYIWAADSNDVRSEGMSYGMMIAVQMDLHQHFDRLWNFAKQYMQFSADGPLKNYFHWQGFVTGSSVTFNNSGPAPDGDEYFAAALYLADRRWGSAGAINYKQEADAITTAFLHNTPSSSWCNLFNQVEHQIVFFPSGKSCLFTDPSYHLPAFYELFALYGPSADNAAWKAQAAASRQFLVKSAHGVTGLHPDYATFSGAPTNLSVGDGHDLFSYDAWRVPLNMAVDYAWFSGDPSMKAQIEKYHSFFTGYLGTGNVTQSRFNVDGTGAKGGGSTALTATLAAGALASAASNRNSYVNNAWLVSQQSGLYRYYQEGVYLLGMLAASGKYCYDFE